MGGKGAVGGGAVTGDGITMKSTRAVVRDKAIKIYRHLIHGLMPADIMNVEGLPAEQVYWYIQEGGRILGGELALITSSGLLKEMVLNSRERRKQGWMLYATAKQEAVKTSILRTLVVEDQHLIDLAERMKLVEPKTTRVEHSGGIDVRHQFFVDIILRSRQVDAIAPTTETHGHGNGHGHPRIA